MRCNSCPLFKEYNDENGYFANCEIFGDAWDSDFQYYNRAGDVCGCYLEICYIKNKAKQRDDLQKPSNRTERRKDICRNITNG